MWSLTVDAHLCALSKSLPHYGAPTESSEASLTQMSLCLEHGLASLSCTSRLLTGMLLQAPRLQGQLLVWALQQVAEQSAVAWAQARPALVELAPAQVRLVRGWLALVELAPA